MLKNVGSLGYEAWMDMDFSTENLGGNLVQPVEAKVQY